jgi:hypothetical protein
LENALRECVERGWQAFKADWVAKDFKTTAPAPTGPDLALQRINENRALAVKPPPEILAKLAQLSLNRLRVNTDAQETPQA